MHDRWKSRYLLFYWGCAALFMIALTFFGYSLWPPKSQVQFFSLVTVVVGPPLFYPATYYVLSDSRERQYVKGLAEMWGPFWVAIAALCLVLVEHAQ